MFLNQIFTSIILMIICQSVYADDEVIKRPVDDSYEEGWTKVKQYSDKEIAETCRKYEGKFIGYYDELYKVEKCKRRAVTRGKKLMKKDANIHVDIVEPDVVAKLPIGSPLDSEEASHKRSCKEIEGHYVTYTYTNIFIVKNCKLRKFPDWETFQSHRKKNNTMSNPILALKENEFFALRQVRPIASEIDKVFEKVLTGEAGVDVIPLDEACEGVEGKDVFYYSKIYKIEKCRKREYDPELYIKTRGGKVTLKELTSSQWLSLPDGSPMEKAKI